MADVVFQIKTQGAVAIHPAAVLAAYLTADISLDGPTPKGHASCTSTGPTRK